MCYLVLHHNVRPDVGVVLLGNRDEYYRRAFDRPRRLDGILAPRDRVAGGTWLGLGQDGLVTAITNRGRDVALEDVRSRGLLVQDVLGRSSAAEARAWLADHLAGQAYAGFHLAVADADDAFLLRHDASSEPHFDDGDCFDVSGHSSVLSNLHEIGVLDLPAALDPQGEADLARWLLAHEHVAADATTPLPGDHRILKRDQVRGTVCSTLIAVPADGGAPTFRFAAGPPDRAVFRTVSS